MSTCDDNIDMFSDCFLLCGAQVWFRKVKQGFGSAWKFDFFYQSSK